MLTTPTAFSVPTSFRLKPSSNTDDNFRATHAFDNTMNPRSSLPHCLLRNQLTTVLFSCRSRDCRGLPNSRNHVHENCLANPSQNLSNSAGEVELPAPVHRHLSLHSLLFTSTLHRGERHPIIQEYASIKGFQHSSPNAAGDPEPLFKTISTSF